MGVILHAGRWPVAPPALCYRLALVMSIPPRALLASPPRVLSLGLPLFAAELERLGVAVTHLDWRPPAGADARLAAALERLEQHRPVIDQANAVALQRLVDGDPVLVDCRPAWEALGLPARTVLHAGPPVEWPRMCEPMRAAVLCAIRYEGWAANDDAAAGMIERGEVTLTPCHHRGAVGPMTGI